MADNNFEKRDAVATAQNDKVVSEGGNTDPAKRGDQRERPPKICGCTCRMDCNCKCTCPHRDHCVCARSPCEGKCGDRVSRNLVISIDGTSNQFGIQHQFCRAPHSGPQ
ncbi:hypothetical protein C8R44DRAFT_324221 [Mycena epipterygia]|nr:hypothetical protein C8R44DRAFT_324221 [Mycena epipterygia]